MNKDFVFRSDKSIKNEIINKYSPYIVFLKNSRIDGRPIFFIRFDLYDRYLKINKLMKNDIENDDWVLNFFKKYENKITKIPILQSHSLDGHI